MKTRELADAFRNKLRKGLEGLPPEDHGVQLIQAAVHGIEWVLGEMGSEWGEAVLEDLQKMQDTKHLLGRLPRDKPDLPERELPMFDTAIPSGRPSDLAAHRPDMKAANASLRAEKARKNSAILQFLPTFQLYGQTGEQAKYINENEDDFVWEVGATVSILIDILRKRKNFKLTMLEATILLLGVYEETGSLTYRTTTRLDVDTVSFLLSKGANLQAVSSYLNRKLTEEELAFLTSLIGSTKVLYINGVNVAIAEAAVERFIGELGTIVRKLEEVEKLAYERCPAVFALTEKVRLNTALEVK